MPRKKDARGVHSLFDGLSGVEPSILASSREVGLLFSKSETKLFGRIRLNRFLMAAF
jgi:hypothetical protein